MPLIVNLRHLEENDVVLRGELPVDELDLDTRDEMIGVTQPLRHELEVQLLDRSLLIRGSLRLVLGCRCVRCLKPFEHELVLNPWTRHLPLEGEEQVPVVNDCADLTPYVREDMLLEFPRHPLCKPDCRGSEKIITGNAKNTGGKDETIPSAWAELDKLKL
ncbi:MAG: YceD family protein [Verrucomicrobiota bacterium]|jgi:uncharacterized protein